MRALVVLVSLALLQSSSNHAFHGPCVLIYVVLIGSEGVWAMYVLAADDHSGIQLN